RHRPESTLRTHRRRTPSLRRPPTVAARGSRSRLASWSGTARRQRHPSPHLGAIHRVLPGVGIEQALDLANAVAEVVPSDLTAPQDGLLLVSPKGHGHLVHNIDPRALAEAMPDRSSEWRNLPTAALHEVLLPLW